MPPIRSLGRTCVKVERNDGEGREDLFHMLLAPCFPKRITGAFDAM